MLTYGERIERMKGKTPEELYRTGLEFFAEGEEWEASRWYQAAIDKGSIDAAFAMARMKENQYHDGTIEPIRQEFNTIVRLYEKASEHGHKNAGIYLGNFLKCAMSGEEEDIDSDCELAERALSAFDAAAANGNKEAYYYIVELYGMGYLDNPANMFSMEYCLKGAKADSYGGYLGL